MVNLKYVFFQKIGNFFIDLLSTEQIMSRGYFVKPSINDKQLRILFTKIPTESNQTVTLVGGNYAKTDDLFIHRSVGGAGSVVLSLLVHTEGTPCGRTEDLFLGYVVHTYGNT